MLTELPLPPDPEAPDTWTVPDALDETLVATVRSPLEIPPAPELTLSAPDARLALIPDRSEIEPPSASVVEAPLDIDTLPPMSADWPTEISMLPPKD